MSRLKVYLASAACAGLSACAPVSQHSRQAAQLCDEISGDATMLDRFEARRNATIALFHQIDGTRRYFAKEGYPRVHEAGRRRSECRRYALIPALHRCVVTALICGRP